MGKIISVANQKGGVGKTTTSINLSASISVTERKVLLIDMDPQANATTGFGIEKRNIEKNIYDLMISDETEKDISEYIISTGLEYLDIIPSTPELAGAEIELVKEFSRERILKRYLDKIKDDYEYIIIDTPPSLGLLTINALTASDSVLIPIQCEYYALEGLAELLNSIRKIQRSLNENLSIEGAVLTMFDSRLNLSKQVAEDVRGFFSDKVFKTVITRNVKLGEAPSFGKPVILYDIMSQGSENYLNLAKEIISNGKN